MKIQRGVIFFLAICILLTSFASAYSLSDALNQLDEQTLLLGLVFIVSFTVINFAVGRFFSEQRSVASIIAFAASLTITYEINRIGFNLTNFFYGFGISSDLLFTIAPLVVIAGLIYLIWKFTLRGVLTVLGTLLILISFTNLVYDKQTVFIIGIILLAIGIALYVYKGKSRNIDEKIREPRRRSFWEPKEPKIPSGNIELLNRKKGIQRLIKEAQAYKKIANKQPNPKMYRSWAHFIHYLKKRGYGKSEKEMMQRLHIRQGDILLVVKKHIL